MTTTKKRTSMSISDASIEVQWREGNTCGYGNYIGEDDAEPAEAARANGYEILRHMIWRVAGSPDARAVFARARTVDGIGLFDDGALVAIARRDGGCFAVEVLP